jgi:hypothetical protein
MVPSNAYAGGPRLGPDHLGIGGGFSNALVQNAQNCQGPEDGARPKSWPARRLPKPRPVISWLARFRGDILRAVASLAPSSAIRRRKRFFATPRCHRSFGYESYLNFGAKNLNKQGTLIGAADTTTSRLSRPASCWSIAVCWIGLDITVQDRRLERLGLRVRHES